jgi:hypothetical protein
MQSVPSEGHALSQFDKSGEARPLHRTNLRDLSERSLASVRRAPAPCPRYRRYRGPRHQQPNHFMRDDQPRTGTAFIFALTDEAWNNMPVQVERTGVKIVIAVNQLAGLTLPRDHVADLHRALGRYLEGES